MADVIEKVVKVDVSGAVNSLDELREEVISSGYSFKSLGDAKRYIDTLRASLIDLDEESEEYAERVAEIDKVQAKLNAAMKVTGSSLKAAEGSYNALSKKMSELKKRFKETNDEAERKVLAKSIVEVNDKLKEMDASIGNYQRNVGNYEAAFTKGLTNISAKIEALGNPLAIAKNGVLALSKAFKSLIANPVGAVIMAIVVALRALKKGFDQSEEASNSLKRAFSALQPVMNAVSKVFTGFAIIVGKIAENVIPALVTSIQKAGEWMMTLLNKIGVVSDEKLNAYKKSIEAQKAAIKVTQDLTDREIGLTEKKRKYQVDEAKTEMEIAELRDKAADKERYTAKEREKFLNEAIAKEKSINSQKLALAQEEYDILKKRSELTDNSKEVNDRLAQAEANLYNTKREYYEKERSLMKERQKAGKELSAAEQKRLAEAEKVLQELEKKRQDELKQIEEIKDRIALGLLSSEDRELEILRRKYEEEKALLIQYEEDTTKLTEEYERQKQEIIDKNGRKSAQEVYERASDALLSSSERDVKTITKKYDEEKRLLEKYNLDTVNLTKEYESKVTDAIFAGTTDDLKELERRYDEGKKLLEQNGVDTVKLTEEYKKKVADAKVSQGEKKIKETDEESAIAQFIADKTIDIEWKKKQRILEIDRERLEGQKKIYEELLNTDNLSAEKKEEYQNKLAKINAEIVENGEKTKDAQIEQVQAVVDTYGQVVEGLGNLMGQVADIWQDSIKQRQKNGKITEEQAKKEFEDSKKLQIATAIINGLAGVAMAVSTAMSLGPIAGPIMAAVNSALVIATTAAQIAKIKSTTFDSGGSSVSTESSVVVPTETASAYVPSYSTNITGESDTVNLANAVSERQGSQRVYVVESDINEVGRRVQVVESESTF